MLTWDSRLSFRSFSNKVVLRAALLLVTLSKEDCKDRRDRIMVSKPVSRLSVNQGSQDRLGILDNRVSKIASKTSASRVIKALQVRGNLVAQPLGNNMVSSPRASSTDSNLASLGALKVSIQHCLYSQLLEICSTLCIFPCMQVLKDNSEDLKASLVDHLQGSLAVLVVQASLVVLKDSKVQQAILNNLISCL